MNPDQVVQEVLNALGKVRYVIPGCINRISSFVMRHLLPRKAEVKFIDWTLSKTYVE